MSYQILMFLPFLAIASCLALVVCVLAICKSASPPRADGFAVHERRKMQLALAARTPVMLPPGGASRRAVDIRV